MRPLISIITVTYNAQDTISRTLQSVANQSCQLYEHIIVDGASKDETLSIVEEFKNDKMTVNSKPDKGIYHAMNIGLSIAKGDYVLFLNSGDTLHSDNTLQQIADSILENDYPGIVYGQTDIVDKEGKYIGPRHLIAPEILTLDSFKEGMVVCHQSFVVLRQLTRFFNTKYKFSADYEWCIICLQHSRRNVYINDVICDYLCEGATTKHHKESLKERFNIMCTYFGWPTAVKKHIKFLFRYLKRRKNSANVQ